MRAWITAEPISAKQLLEAVGDPEDGAVLLFLGTVRCQNQGREVRGMRYEAYQDMAQRTLNQIAREAVVRVGVERIAVAHRIGELSVGDISVGIAISTPHRAEAYEGSRYIIEEIKRRLPVWKKEQYAAGEARWLGAPLTAVQEAAHE